MEQVENRVSSAALRVITGRRVDVVIAIVRAVVGRRIHVVLAMLPRNSAGIAGLIEVVMQFSVRNVGGFPELRSRSGNHDDAVQVDVVWEDKPVQRVQFRLAIYVERVPVDLRGKRRRCHAPYSVGLCHGEGSLHSGDGNLHLFRVHVAIAEGDGAVGMNLMRVERPRRLSQHSAWQQEGKKCS